MGDGPATGSEEGGTHRTRVEINGSALRVFTLLWLRSLNGGGERPLVSDGCTPRSGSEPFVAQPEVFEDLCGLTQTTRERRISQLEAMNYD